MIALALIAAVAVADPVHLECQMHRFVDVDTPRDAPWNWHVTVHEAAGRVDWNDGERSGTSRAIITSDEVRWGNIKISRIDLKMTRLTVMGSGIPDMISVGRCRLATPVERAF